ncbi:hypothetical protein AB0D49_32875 [Streptomyces sp. NPDC048290]
MRKLVLLSAVALATAFFLSSASPTTELLDRFLTERDVAAPGQ